ncbi:L-rhamnose-binding lectin SML-like [Oryzias melastigma]|uniref:L-rhamnose-binding lectin SML-like n=1 Tax=Oryzias melastigma TaxID=30732 RepID=UPI00168D82C6|nr:L-rhamnose-binding lectin SML-like [Oryzias melastigma]
MLLFRLSPTMFLAAVCLFMASAVSTETVTTCVDYNNPHYLECENGVINVKSVFYGRTNKVICSEGRPPHQLSNTECSQPGTVNFVKDRCNGRKSCEISLNDIINPDPCYGIYKYLQTNFTCVPAVHLIACEHSYAHLTCGQGEAIFVLGANYGRQDRNICYVSRPPNQVQNVYCSNPTQIVAQRCSWERNCTIYASNLIFGDPCPGTFKYLELSYVCLNPLAG